MPTAVIDALDDDVDRVVELLEEGEDPNNVWKDDYDFSRTPLFEAVGALPDASTEKVEALLDAVVVLLRHGAIVTDNNEDRAMSPLLSAVHYNQIACARILLAAGADPNVYGDEGETTLRLCAEHGHQEMALLLLRCGANVYRSGGPDGMNALGIAASRLNIEIVRLFLVHGADPNVPDNDGKTVFERLQRFPVMARPETPEKLERFREIRRLIGFPEP